MKVSCKLGFESQLPTFAEPATFSDNFQRQPPGPSSSAEDEYEASDHLSWLQEGRIFLDQTMGHEDDDDEPRGYGWAI